MFTLAVTCEQNLEISALLAIADTFHLRRHQRTLERRRSGCYVDRPQLTHLCRPTQVATLPIGFTLDRIGPKRTSILGAVLFALGCVSFGSGLRTSWLDGYYLGFALLALGGPLIFLPSFHLSNAFPAYSGLILSAVTGAFDASSIPFVIYKSIYEAVDGRFSIRTFFWLYTIFPALVIIEQLTIAPSTIYQRGGETALLAEDGVESDDEDEEQEVLADEPVADTNASAFSTMLASANAGLVNSSSFSRIHYGDAHDDDEALIETHGTKDTLVGTLFGRSASQQVASIWFLVLTAFVCTHMARINFYILSCAAQLEFYTGDAKLAETLTTLFTILLPLGGLVGVPFVGFLLDSRPWIDTGYALMLMGLIFGICGVSSNSIVQMIGIGAFCFFRPLMYTSVSDAFARVMGFQHFGTVYGTAMSMSGIVGMINAPLDVLVKTKLGGDYLPVDIMYIVLGFVTSGALLFKVWQATRQRAIVLE